MGSSISSRFWASLWPVAIQFALGTALPGVAGAEEANGSLPSGAIQLESNPHVVLLSQEVELQPDLARAQYRLRNRSGQRQTIGMNVLLPSAQWWETKVPTIYESDYLGTKISVSGTPVAWHHETRALFRGKDITRELVSLGVPVTWGGPFSTADWPKSLIVKLKKQGLLKRQSLAVMDDEPTWVPQWKLQTKLHWQQEFAPQEELMVEQTHQPISGFDRQESGRLYCVPGKIEPPSKANVHRISTAFLPVVLGGNSKHHTALTLVVRPGLRTKRFATCIRGLTKRPDGSWYMRDGGFDMHKTIRVLWFEDWEVELPGPVG